MASVANYSGSVEVESHPSEAAARERLPASWVAGLCVSAVLVRLFFWWYTGRTWEDALITLQHAENAARGYGLTHFAGGPRVHGFTSPVSVLIPLVGELARPGSGLAVLKCASAIAGAISVFLGIRIAEKLRLAKPVVLLVGGYLAFEHQQILFGMAGMETQVVVAILLFSFYTLFDLKPVPVGIGLGLCMLGRPDFVLWVALVVALLLWHDWGERSFRGLAAALGMCLAVYGPWLTFTTWYYGSPIPNTILAKAYGYGHTWIYASLMIMIHLGVNYVPLAMQGVLLTVFQRVPGFLFGGLAPSYAGNGTGFEFYALSLPVCLIMLCFLIPCVWTVWRKKNVVATGILGFVVVFSMYYMFLMNFVFGWYTVPLAAATILAIAIGLDTTLRFLREERTRRIVGYAIAASYLAGIVVVLPTSFRGDRLVQKYVEDGLRKPIGLYLASIMGPQQSVGCESLGYFGYYSRRLVYDYPGLANARVTRFMRENKTKRSLIGMLDHFRPDYLVLRPQEYHFELEHGNAWLEKDYGVIADYRVSDDQARQILFADHNTDLEFLLLRRRQ